MRTLLSLVKRGGATTAVIFVALMTLTGCTTTRVDTPQAKLAHQRITEPILVLTPVCYEPKLYRTCNALGEYLTVEVPKRVDGDVVYAADVEALEPMLNWQNLIENGLFNRSEIASMARTCNCNSALATQVINVKAFPPFRMVILMEWIDARSGTVIARLYNDVDTNDSEIRYRYSNFIGEGPAKKLYEQIFYSEDLFQTAMLSPKQFMQFVAANSTKVIFSDRHDVPWWYFWRIF